MKVAAQHGDDDNGGTAMNVIECPYCEMEISANQIDAEGGICPECGHPISPDIHDEDMEGDDEGDDDDEDDL